MPDLEPSTDAHAIAAILAHAHARPDAPAIWSEGGSQPLSRGNLAELIHRFGRQLPAFGAEGDDLVLLVAPQGPRTVMSLVALSAYLPVAPVPQGPPAQMADLVHKMKPRFFASAEPPDRHLQAILAEAGVASIALSSDREGRLALAKWDGCGLVPADDAASPMVLATSAHTALVLPTSGTTGRPKLVALTHAHLGHMAINATRALALDESDICVNPMPMTHIHGIAIGTLLPLASGGSCVALTTTSGSAVLAAADRFGATWYTSVPTIHQDVVRAARAMLPTRGSFKLRFARSSSSALAAETRAGLLQYLGIPVLEGLGMTEAASWLVHQTAGTPPGHGTLGHGQGVDVAVLDAAGDISSGPGSEGELLVRGPNVITSYADGEDEDIRFIDGWLRTGDRVQITQDEEIKVIGRLKEMINRGGAALAPVEIEDILLAHPAVARAIAFGVPHRTLGQDLAAAVVLEPGEQIEGAAIRRWMSERVVLEKLPRFILVTDFIPVNAIGKPERIRAAEILGIGLDVIRDAPVGAIETVLQELMHEMMPGLEVGRTEDLFLAGADSLMLMRLQVRIEGMFGVVLTADEIAPNACIAHMGDLLRDRCAQEILTMLDQFWKETFAAPRSEAVIAR